MTATDILQSIIEDGATRPACRHEAQAMLRLFKSLSVTSERDAIVYLLGLAAGLRETAAEWEAEATAGRRATLQ
jgi:hypothetical protein